MNLPQFNADFNRKTRQLEHLVKYEFPVMAGKKILRFIDGNFRAQGYQGATFQRWVPNARNRTILIRRGDLRRGFRQELNPGQVRIYNNVPYAKAHNEGFSGTVTVAAHERRKFAKTQVGTGRYNKNGTERKKTVHVQTGTQHVKSHQRKMNVKKRQMAPITWNDSPVLVSAMQRDLVKSIKKIYE